MNSIQEIQTAQAEWRDMLREMAARRPSPDGCHTYYVRAWGIGIQTTAVRHAARRRAFRRPRLLVCRDKRALMRRAERVIRAHRAALKWDMIRLKYFWSVDDER